MAKLEVLNPVAQTSAAKFPLASRVSSLNGKVIGLYDNRKPSSDVALRRLTEQLGRQFQGVQFRRYVGSMGGRAVATSQDAERMAKECNVVIGIRAD